MFENLGELSEGTVRLICFGGIFAVIALWELAAPRRKQTFTRPVRWFTNISLVVIDTLALRLLFPVLAVGVAEFVQLRQWGLFNSIDLPGWLEITVAVIALDLAIYFQHFASHKVPILWRVHRVHHADRDFDLTTAIRFHPVEICLSMLYKFAVILVLGPAPLAVFLFEVLLNGTAMFNHGNIRLPGPADRLLRLVLVTPDMHRVHHSIEQQETDSNYGFNLSVWDRLFQTYKGQPDAGHDEMVIGLAPYQTDDPTRLGWSLMFPFRRNGKD